MPVVALNEPSPRGCRMRPVPVTGVEGQHARPRHRRSQRTQLHPDGCPPRIAWVIAAGARAASITRAGNARCGFSAGAPGTIPGGRNARTESRIRRIGRQREAPSRRVESAHRPRLAEIRAAAGRHISHDRTCRRPRRFRPQPGAPDRGRGHDRRYAIDPLTTVRSTLPSRSSTTRSASAPTAMRPLRSRPSNRAGESVAACTASRKLTSA